MFQNEKLHDSYSSPDIFRPMKMVGYGAHLKKQNVDKTEGNK